MASTTDFYDELANYYHLIYSDWDGSLHRQAQSLASVLQHSHIGPPSQILDAACGIGTQALGLAQLGYRVAASDISAGALQKAREYAAERGQRIDFFQADIRLLSEVFSKRFDAVIACDNSIPHLLSDGAILEAFQAIFQVLKPNGLALISVRDYAKMDLGGVQIHPRLVHDENGVRLVLCDVWDFQGDHYSITIYLISDQEGKSPNVKAIRGGQYYCVTIDKLKSLFHQAGFVEVDVLKEAYFQPLIVAKKPPDPTRSLKRNR